MDFSIVRRSGGFYSALNTVFNVDEAAVPDEENVSSDDSVLQALPRSAGTRSFVPMDSGSIKSSNTCSDAAVSFSDRHCRFSNCVIGQVTERIDGACFVDDSNEIMVLETTKKPVVARKRKRSAVSSYGSCEEKKKRRVSHPLHAGRPSSSSYSPACGQSNSARCPNGSTTNSLYPDIVVLDSPVASISSLFNLGDGVQPNNNSAVNSGNNSRDAGSLNGKPVSKSPVVGPGTSADHLFEANLKDPKDDASAADPPKPCDDNTSGAKFEPKTGPKTGADNTSSAAENLMTNIDLQNSDGLVFEGCRFGVIVGKVNGPVFFETPSNDSPSFIPGSISGLQGLVTPPFTTSIVKKIASFSNCSADRYISEINGPLVYTD